MPHKRQLFPSHVGKTADQIVAIPECNAGGYLLRSMAWLDYFTRKPAFSPLLYACAEGRNGIEYLLFQELVVSTGADLSPEEYQRCVKERKRFEKTIAQLSPDFALLKRFAEIVVSLTPDVPTLVDWDHRMLMRAWGELSEYLHWFGVRNLTSENPAWLEMAADRIRLIVEPLWNQLAKGDSGILHPKDMHPVAREVWERFKSGAINEVSAKFQLQVLRPVRGA